MLERRVEALENRSERIEDILKRLEPMIVELVTHAVRRSDVTAARDELRGEMAEHRAELRGEFGEFRTELRGDIAGLREGIAGLGTRLGVVEGRTLGVELALRQVPNTWQIIAIFLAAGGVVAATILGLVRFFGIR